MKKIIFLFLLICSVLTVHCQEIVKEVPLEISNPRDDVRVLDYDILPDPTRPELHFDNPYYRDITDDPKLTGFENMVMNSLWNNFYYSIIGKSDVWEGITTINSALFQLHYNTDLWNFTVGSSLWKYDGKIRPFGDAAFHATASVNPLPWLTLGAYGQYSVMSERNFKRHGGIMPAPMIPYSGFGGFGRVMLNSTFGVEGSLGRQFNPMKGGWETTFSVGPAIDLSRKKKKK